MRFKKGEWEMPLGAAFGSLIGTLVPRYIFEGTLSWPTPVTAPVQFVLTFFLVRWLIRFLSPASTNHTQGEESEE